MKLTLTIAFWLLLLAALACVAKCAMYAPPIWSMAAGTLGLLAAFTYAGIPNQLPNDNR